MKYFKLILEDDLHTEIKSAAAKKRLTMQQCMVNLLSQALKASFDTKPLNKVNDTLQRRKPKTTNSLSSPKPTPIIETIGLSTGEVIKCDEWDWICSACTEAIDRHDLPLSEFAALIEEHIALEHPKGIGRRSRRDGLGRRRILGSKEMESDPNKEEDKQPWELH